MILVTFKYVLTWSIVKLVLLSKATEATPVVTLTTSHGYISIGGSLTLTCQVNQDVGLATVYYEMGGIQKIWVYNITNCGYFKTDPNEENDPTFNYSITCSGQRSLTMIKYGITSSDHRKTWHCQMLSAKGAGPCETTVSLCISPRVTTIIRIPVTTAQLVNGSGQALPSSVNIVRDQSSDIRCSTAPRGSRPRATFQWYIRQGNQSPVLIVDQRISPTPNPITVPGQPESDLLISYSTWTLTGNESYQDMYIYCQAQDETNTGNYAKSDEVQLNIVYTPAVLLSTHQSIYNVTEGMQNFVFTCNIIEANPLPQPNSYSWFHNTSIIPGQTSSSYTIPSVQRAHAGEYICTARNDYGTGTSNFLDLIVQLVKSAN